MLVLSALFSGLVSGLAMLTLSARNRAGPIAAPTRRAPVAVKLAGVKEVRKASRAGVRK
jgi:hypothetical protein